MGDKKYIKLTKKKVQEVFQICNEKYFDNKISLPDRIELWTPSNKCVGWIRAVWDMKRRKFVTALHISQQFKWTYENLEHTIVHEMIHMENKDYLIKLPFWKRLFGLDHDKKFVARMNEINEKYGLNITVRAKHMKTEMIKTKKGATSL